MKGYAVVTSTARITTRSAERYAKQLCDHANHMGARATWEPPDGRVDFPQGGVCRLTAQEAELILVVEADRTEQLTTIQAILSADFERFGHRQGMTVDWSHQ